MSGTITLGSSNGTIVVNGDGAPSVDVNGNSGGITLGDLTSNNAAATLSSYQRAVIEGYSGTESEFYENLSEVVSKGVVPAVSSDIGNRISNGPDGLLVPPVAEGQLADMVLIFENALL